MSSPIDDIRAALADLPERVLEALGRQGDDGTLPEAAAEEQGHAPAAPAPGGPLPDLTPALEALAALPDAFRAALDRPGPAAVLPAAQGPADPRGPAAFPFATPDLPDAAERGPALELPPLPGLAAADNRPAAAADAPGPFAGTAESGLLDALEQPGQESADLLTRIAEGVEALVELTRERPGAGGRGDGGGGPPEARGRDALSWSWSAPPEEGRSGASPSIPAGELEHPGRPEKRRAAR